jgi:hypothetical protein
MLHDSSRLMAIAQQAQTLPDIVNTLQTSNSSFTDAAFPPSAASLGAVASKASGWLLVRV